MFQLMGKKIFIILRPKNCISGLIWMQIVIFFAGAQIFDSFTQNGLFATLCVHVIEPYSVLWMAVNSR